MTLERKTCLTYTLFSCKIHREQKNEQYLWENSACENEDTGFIVFCFTVMHITWYTLHIPGIQYHITAKCMISMVRD